MEMLSPVDFPIRFHLQFIVHGLDELGTPPSTLPTVSTNGQFKVSDTLSV